ncbi:MAG: hypothetical protein [Wendovervirus sonii]|uniref:Uncharacterized protein n=1 Tax=phage Lak_Megaphage_Sonny TaxID=3109229 RepID=A0ABZ0Z2F6_9CAUD|nr:MAG: hypothetical protein [phage Lak_Megaphage_Sonny]
MENIKCITPNCFIIINENGFNQLCEHLQCIPEDEYSMLIRTKQFKKISNKYSYVLFNVTKNFSIDCIDNSQNFTKRITNEDIAYPCLLSFFDDTFETSSYAFYISSNNLNEIPL